MAPAGGRRPGQWQAWQAKAGDRRPCDGRAVARSARKQEAQARRRQARQAASQAGGQAVNSQNYGISQNCGKIFFSYFSRDRPKPPEARLFQGKLPKRDGDQKDNLRWFLASWNRYFYCCLLGEVPKSLF